MSFIKFDTLVQRCADDGMDIRAEGLGAGKVFVRAAAIIPRYALRVGRELNLSAPAQTDRISVSFRMQHLPQFLPSRHAGRKLRCSWVQLSQSRYPLSFSSLTLCPSGLLSMEIKRYRPGSLHPAAFSPSA